jgi:DNA mismatch repair protein PMS2
MQGATKLEENISSVLGSSFLSGMCRISIDLPIQSPPGEWRVVGLISKAPHLSARDGSLARNAQFFSINGRPVDLPKISRSLSDAWRKIDTTSKKKPACILLFSLPKTAYDVNLAPNKRQVLLIDESKVCTSIVEGALALWNSQRDGIFLSHEVDLCKGKVDSPDLSKDTPSGRKVMRRLGFYNDFRHVKLQHDSETTQLQGTSNVNQIHVREENSSSTYKDQFNIVSVTVGSTQGEKNEPHRTDSKYDDCTDADKRLFIKVQDQFRKQNDGDIKDPLICSDHTTPTCEIDYSKTDGNQEMKETQSLDSSIHKSSQISFDNVGCQGKRPECQTLLKSIDSSSKTVIDSTHPSPPSNVDRKKASIREHFTSARTTVSEQSNQETKISEGSQVNGDEAVHSICAKDAIAWTSFKGTDFVVESSRKSRLELSDHHRRLKRLRSDIPSIDRTFEVEDFGMELDEPVACDRTSKVSLSKKDFEQMEVIGQFNLGFILAKCHCNNLWVLDQHACDEKYNFELLCEKTVLQEQKLLAPMPLELTPSEENCILENLKVFEQSGFRFSHSDDNSGQRQLSLISLPHSGARDGRKAVQFGKDDVRALCAILGADGNGFAPQDGGTGVDGSGSYGNNAVRRYAGLSQKGENVMSRLPKAVAMFANRACRGSVMIGTALSKKEMETIVHRLANVEHPWNCPHGRPTLKHVTDLMKVECSDLRGTLVYNVGPTMATESEITQPDID